VVTEKTVEISIARIRKIATEAYVACGGGLAMAKSLVDATISAAQHGRTEVGFAHFVDYLESLCSGRIDGKATPQIDISLPAFIRCDARGGIAQFGFDIAFDRLVDCVKRFGIAIFTQKNSYTAGELGYYVRRLAAEGLISMAVANSHAMMAAAAGGKPVFGTNPLAFAAPLPAPQPALVVDQATSATAFVKIVRAAAENMEIPAGWATDRDGSPTIDPSAAMLGALLPFGGYKGANIALLVEILSAGLTGAAWSLDAGNFRSGGRSPNTGLTVIAVSAHRVDRNFEERLSEHLRRLAELGLHMPGIRSSRNFTDESDTIAMEASVLAAISSYIP
jgi:(2R)-3-sulfolactate dehydrogenase (NADP+)